MTVLLQRVDFSPPLLVITCDHCLLLRVRAQPPQADGKGDVAREAEGEKNVGSMLSEAVSRKERLRALRLKTLNREAATGEATETSAITDTLLEHGALPQPVFRNYKPTSDDLKEGELPRAGLIDLGEHVKKYIEAAGAQGTIDEVNLVNLAPRKPDWDLKRSVAKKLKKLDRRTQRAITEIIRERLKNEPAEEG